MSHLQKLVIITFVVIFGFSLFNGDCLVICCLCVINMHHYNTFSWFCIIVKIVASTMKFLRVRITAPGKSFNKLILSLIFDEIIKKPDIRIVRFDSTTSIWDDAMPRILRGW